MGCSIARGSLAVKGSSVKPQKAYAVAYLSRMAKGTKTKGPRRADKVPISPTRGVLAANLRQLMASNPDLKSSPKLEARSHVALSTINRVRNKKTAANVDTIYALARAFKLDSWQMLVPGLKVDEPPRLAPSREERERYEKFREAAREFVEAASEPKPGETPPET